MSRWMAAALILSGALLVSPLWAQTADDGFDPSVPTGAVWTVAIEPGEGRPLIGGSFSDVGGAPRQSLARLRIDGSVDLGFQANIGAASVVQSIAPLTDGHYLVAGNLTSVAGAARGNVVRIGPFGTVDAAFDPQVIGDVMVVVEDLSDPDEPGFYVGGSITSVGGQVRNGIARLHADGSLDAGFMPPNFNGAIHALMPLPDGGVLVGGFLGIAGQGLDGRMYRLAADGAVAEDFQVEMDVASGQASVRSIVRQNDGNYLVAGSFDTVNGQARPRIVRMDGDGNIDAGYVPPAFNGTIFSVALQPDGRAVVVGNFTDLGGRDRIARLRHDGSVDDSFAEVSADAQLYGAAVQDDGSIIVAGTFNTIDGVDRQKVARLLPDGELEQTLVALVTGGEVRAVVHQPDGRIVLGGLFGEVNGQEYENLVRLNPDGSVDGSFQVAVNRDVLSVVLLDDDRLVIAGDFSLINNEWNPGIARLAPDGSVDETFLADLGAGSATALAVQSDGRLIVGVSVPPARGSSGEFVLRLNADGSVDEGFQELELDGAVHAISAMFDGRILLGGEFTQVNGVGRNRIARLLADGSIDPDFDPGADGAVWSLSVNFSGSALVGGDFSQVGGVPRSRLARIADNGNVANPNIGADGRVGVLLAQRGGFDFVGGEFTTIGFQPRNRLALLAGNNLGAYDGAIGPTTLWSGAIQSDGKVLVGGDFFEVGGEERSNIARLTGFNAVRQTIRRSLADGNVTWDIAGSLPDAKAMPQLLIATTCCDRSDFEVLPGEMFNAGQDWVYEGFPELEGVFYLRVRARVGDGKGGGSGLFESPIHQFIGAGPDGIFADGFEIPQ